MTERDEADIRVITVAQADPGELSSFFRDAFGPLKARFIAEQGDWWYRDPSGRYLVTYDGAIVGCDAKQPVVCVLQGQEVYAVWGMDLYVRPEYRGRGLQSLLYRSLPEDAEMVMGFPTREAAERMVHLGSRIREDLTVLSAPLRPRSMEAVRSSEGARGISMRAKAVALAPPAALFRAWAARYRPRHAELVKLPDLQVLEGVFHRYVTRDVATIVRSSEFLRWRYLGAPYLSELRFYLCGSSDRPTHYAITRLVASEDSMKVRILDLFGDFTDTDMLVDLFRTIVRDAAQQGADSVMALAGLPEIVHAARAAGFLLRIPRRFHWEAVDPNIQDRLSTARLHWCYADGDNDGLPNRPAGSSQTGPGSVAS